MMVYVPSGDFSQFMKVLDSTRTCFLVAPQLKQFVVNANIES